MQNKYTKMIWLRDVADDKQLFTLTGRSKAPLYNKQTKDKGVIFITSNNSGRTFRKKAKTNVYIKSV